MRFHVQIPAETETLGDFFPCLSLSGQSYQAPVTGGSYPMELVEVRTRWPNLHSY